MNTSDKRCIFYFLLILGIGEFFWSVYEPAYSDWEKIEQEAQRSIDESLWDLEFINGKESISVCSWVHIQVMGDIDSINSLYDNEYRRCKKVYDVILEYDSLPSKWLDTIVIIRNYTRYSDTIKVALEDL